MRCSNCHHDNPEDARFCSRCGSALQASVQQGAERRLVTVLFADVTGSTALGEAMDPEDVRALLARYYAIAQEVVPAHGGTLEKFIGDAVMAIFGLPQAHGDDAERAVAAALELRQRVRNEPVLGERLPIRIGVNTGDVVATRDAAARDFLITGDAVNVAARLQQTAQPWEILCGERTALAAVEAFSFGPPLDVAAKGRQTAVRGRLLLGRTAGPRLRRIPLIGREHDLSHLELVARRAFGERRPFLVTIVAPAGTGKSRLLEEFIDRLPQTAGAAEVAVAQCLPYGQRLTYWPLRSVLTAIVGVSEDARPDVIHRGVLEWLRREGVEEPERVAGFLAATVGAGEAEVADRDSLFGAWRTFVETAAAHTPLVLVFEDLHWSSDSLLDLVEFVMQPRGDVPILMIALARPELIDRRQAWGGGRRNYVSLALEPLSDDAVRQLAIYLLGEDVPDIVTRVVARSEGNPFYAGEIVRAVMEQVTSIRDREAVEQALAVLPDTIQATVLARLDLLEEPERRVLQLGSVFGRTFRPRGVAALERDLEPYLDRVIDRLVEKDMVRPSDRDRWAFRHILIREVAYQTLPRAERARLHAEAGRWLEGIAEGREEVLSELIAYHYREAAVLYRASEPQGARAAELSRLAARWLVRAADAARSGAAFLEARRHLRHAIDLADHQDLPHLYRSLGDVSWGDDGVAAYRQALELTRTLGRSSDEELGILGSLLTLHMRWQGTIGHRPTPEEIQPQRDRGRVLLGHAVDDRAKATFLIAEGFYPFWLRGGDLEVSAQHVADAEESARQALEIAERLDDARLRSAALDALGSVAQQRGQATIVRDMARKRLAFGDRLDTLERSDAHAMVAWVSTYLGDLEEAVETSRAGLSALQPGQAQLAGLHMLSWRIYALTLLGRWDEALAAGDQARLVWLEAGLTSTGYAAVGFVSALDVARARQDDVRIDHYRGVLDEILKSFAPDRRIHSIGPYLSLDLPGLGEVLASRAATEQFLTARPDYLERAISLCADHRHLLSKDVLGSLIGHAAAQNFPILEAQARRALGIFTSDRAELDRALELFEQTGARPSAARVRCERGALFRDDDDLKAGIRILEGLGDLDYLSRVALRSAEPAVD